MTVIVSVPQGMKKMKFIAALFVCCCCFVEKTVSEDSHKFILTAPKELDAGSTEYFTLTIFDGPPGLKVKLQLLHLLADDVIAESEPTLALTNHNMWVEMLIPSISSDISARLRVIGIHEMVETIHATQDVNIRHNTVWTFVQTDKPLYKPGQTIRFRILPMDNRLKPIGPETVGDVWIEDPSGIRVEQWKNFQFISGISQFELPLSEEPTLGTWKIKTNINKVQTVQTFKVEKYTLPKFEVTITPPAVIMADAESITIEICAKYTYGKRVDGTLSAKISYELSPWGNTPIPSVEYLGQISGCYEWYVSTTDLLLQSDEFGFRRLEIFAEVKENGTEIIRNATTLTDITHKPLNLEFLGPLYYKPSLPYYGSLKVTNPIGNPVTSEKIEICTYFTSPVMVRTMSCNIFTSDKNGIIRFSIGPSDVSMIELQAKAINYNEQKYPESFWRLKIEVPTADVELETWYSPSESFLQIEPVTQSLQCDKLQRVKVLYTASQGASIRFYHQVLSKGRIVQQGSHQRTLYSKDEEREYDFYSNKNNPFNHGKGESTMKAGEFILSFDPRATMSPIARLLIFYVRDDGEIVADSAMFHIEKCLSNKVNFLFRHQQQYPSSDASILLSANPSSICGISMVDKSVTLLENDSTFNKNKLFKLMESFDTNKMTNPKQFKTKYCSDPPFADFPFENSLLNKGSYVDSTMAFEEAGMVVITNLILDTQPCTVPLLPHRQYVAFPLSIDDNINNNGRFQLAASDPTGVESRIPHARSHKGTQDPPKSIKEIRSYFPETWLWELHTVGEKGEMTLNRKLPDTVTEWVGGAICIHPKAGLGISDTSSINAFQPFFISFQLPYSVVRGETLPLIVTVFNYLSECLPIKLALESSEDFKIISEQRFEKVCVCGSQSVSHKFHIRPVTLGTVNITVHGISLEDDDEVCGDKYTARLNARDAVSKPLLVEAEGFPREEVLNYFICPENTNGSYSTEVDLLLPEEIISDSARAYITITGDIMGPALDGLKRLVRLPCGCGEQNMILFVPNIFVMDYLSATQRLTEKTKHDCVNNMKTGYQRELQYRHNDGSYSAFGSRDKEGSLWLTAFVIKSFGQAQRFINIDSKDLERSVEWIVGKQFENGCFEPSGTIHHKEMKGGLNAGDQSLAPLTAYVLISLLESGILQKEVHTVSSGMECLKSETNPSNYALALFAYASVLAKDDKAMENYLKMLNTRATVKDQYKFWESATSSKSVSIETASYYVLAQLEKGDLNDMGDILSVVRWITQQRNSEGGFVSTQDTVVALQALAKYAALQSERVLEMNVIAESDDFLNEVQLDENNKLLTHSSKIPVVPSVVEVNVVGEGCTLIQFSLRYNIKTVLGSDAFDLSVDAQRLGSFDCNLPRLAICMRYKIQGQTSNMVVLSVKMASGFVPDEWSLLLLQNNRESTNEVQLKRFDVTGNDVNLYFDELSNEQKCFDFFMKADVEVEDVKPSIVKLYDYYQPERTVSREYSIPSVCDVTSLPEIPELSPVPLNDAEHSSEATTTAILLNELDKVSESPMETGNSIDLVTIQKDPDDEHQNSSNLSNFIDIQEDLSFPDGLEDNMIVTVTLPEVTNTTDPATVTTDTEDDCPICSKEQLPNFEEIYCTSHFALKIIVKDGNTGTIKILQDLSAHQEPRQIKKFGKIEYEANCVCPQLNEKGKVLLVFGSPLQLWNSKGKKHKLIAKKSIYILSMNSKAIQDITTNARTVCNVDP